MTADPRVFGDPGKKRKFPSAPSPLPHFGATSASCPAACRLPTRVPCRQNPRSESSSPKLLAPSAFPGSLEPFFSPPYGGVRKVASLPKVPSPGFGYPLDGLSPNDPRGPLSAPNALGIPSPEPSSSAVVRSPFPGIAPFLHSSRKPPGLRPVLQGLPPTSEARSLLRYPGGLIQGGTPCSLEVSDLPGPPLAHPKKRASPSLLSPLALLLSLRLRKERTEPQGLPI